MRSTSLDLSFDELDRCELSIGSAASIDMSMTELEEVATPDTSSFVASTTASIAFSGLVIAT